MNVATRLGPLLLATLTATVWAGCSTAGDGTTGDDQNVTGASDCDIKVVSTGKPMTADELSKLHDPVAKLVLGGKMCPKTFKEIVAKLAETDKAGCESPTAEGAFGNVTTQFISETAQLMDKADTSENSYRAVYQRTCGGRSEHEFFISLFGLNAASKDLPAEPVELIGEDKTAGVFNFYAREDGEWRFFGNSKEFVTAGYTCTNGACQSNAGAKQRCAKCHTGGGLNQKELQSPWVHWDQGSQPGSDELHKRFPELGGRGLGQFLEFLVEQGNQMDWTPKRIEALKEKGVEELLRPLFCTMDVNLQSTMMADFYVDPQFDFGLAAFAGNAYPDAIKANGQQILGNDGRPVATKKGPAIDTVEGFTYPARVDTGLDFFYVEGIKNRHIVDTDFVKDVLSIDLTRPIFSKTRCDLLQFAPKLDATKLTSDAIREGFKANLKGKTGAAAELLASLEDTNDSKKHDAVVKAYADACFARMKNDPKGLMADVTTYASHIRNMFRELDIAEFKPTMPVDRVPDTGKAFDPATCTLK